MKINMPQGFRPGKLLQRMELIENSLSFLDPWHVTIPTAYISLIKTYYKETNKRIAKL